MEESSTGMILISLHLMIFDFPPWIVLAANLVCLVSLIKHVISWMILKNDPRNENAMEPLAVLSGYSQKKGLFDIPMEDIERIKVELEPLIAMATI